MCDFARKVTASLWALSGWKELTSFAVFSAPLGSIFRRNRMGFAIMVLPTVPARSAGVNDGTGGGFKRMISRMMKLHAFEHLMSWSSSGAKMLDEGETRLGGL